MYYELGCRLGSVAIH